MLNLIEKIDTGENGVYLNGSLALTNITDLLQFLSVSYKKGMIKLIKEPEKWEGKIFFAAGELVHAVSGNVVGLEGFSNLLSWTEGSFQFFPETEIPATTVGLFVQHAIIEAAVLLDTRSANDQQDSQKNIAFITNIDERSSVMEGQDRDSTEVLNDMLGIPGIDAVVVAGRDGFVIESAGNSNRVNIDELGASLAHATNGIEEMGGELSVNPFQGMFVEYVNAVIMCQSVGDAIVAVISPDASKLGIIRHKTKKFFEELTQSF